jgi:citronellyl-CoA dehydrogenase
LTEREHVSVPAAIRGVVAKVFDNERDSAADSATSGVALLAELGAAGLLEACLDSDSRQWVQTRHLAELIAGLAVSAPTGPALSCVIHTATFLPLLARQADERLAGVVDRARSGQALGGIAATDADRSGSDLTGLDTQVHIGRDNLVVRGAKGWITNATTAEYLVVLARHRSGRDLGAFSLVLVPTGVEGLTVRSADTTLLAGSGLGMVEFDDVTLPAHHLLGRPGWGLASFLDQIVVERLASGVWAVAAGRELLYRTVRHLRGRIVGEEALWERSSVRHELARCAVDLSMLDAAVDRVVEAAMTNRRVPSSETAEIKVAAGAALGKLLDRCVQLHGTAGLTTACGLLALANDLRAFSIAGGSTETMLDLVATDLTGAAR